MLLVKSTCTLAYSSIGMIGGWCWRVAAVLGRAGSKWVSGARAGAAGIALVALRGRRALTLQMGAVGVRCALHRCGG